jgi:nucleotide-binding universal stress UspA family protein
MPFKTMLSITGVDQDDADLINDAELCNRFDVHLNAVVVGCVPPAPIGEVATVAYSNWSYDWEAENSRLEERTAKLSGMLADKGLKGDVQALFCLQAAVADEIGNRACYSDASIIGAGLLNDTFLLKRVLDGALFQSPAPVILAPKTMMVDLAPKTVLLAWSPGVEAGRALRHSMEMMAGAESVHVVVVDPLVTSYADGQEPGADIATFLARHGVKTIVDVLAGGGRQVDDVLSIHALEIGADLIVMGAYGHSRMREWIFGGTTRSMIEHHSVPVLLAR